MKLAFVLTAAFLLNGSAAFGMGSNQPKNTWLCSITIEGDRDCWDNVNGHTSCHSFPDVNYYSNYTQTRAEAERQVTAECKASEPDALCGSPRCAYKK